MARRFYENTLADWNPRQGTLVDGSGKLLPKLKEEIEAIFQELNVKKESMPGGGEGDMSVYTGEAGFAYLNLFLAEKSENNQMLYLEKGLALLEPHVPRLRCRIKDMTFLCGDIGPLCISAVLLLKRGEAKKAASLVEKVLGILSDVLKPDSGMANELLYGRVGYLYSLLFLQKYFSQISELALRQLAEVIIEQGCQTHNNYLMWEWHGQKYLGGAHGVAGIVYLLLQINGEIRPDHKILLENTVNYLLSICFPSGNLPSSVGSNDDRLVHWCHGAPGFVQTLLAAHQVWKKQEYLLAAERCGDVVWQRGLLRKGYGICHGVAGNAYTFLALYQSSGNEMHLHRALQFARWCSTFDKNQDHQPDRPSSLFEGLAGTLYFLKDIQNPAEAVFPCYSVKPFQNCVSV